MAGLPPYPQHNPWDITWTNNSVPIPAVGPGSVMVSSGTGTSWQPTTSPDDTSNLDEYHIKGRMFAVEHSVDNYTLENLAVPINVNYIKDDLLGKLISEMKSSGYVEFTSQKDVATDKTTFRARIFAVPDTQVKIIRVNKIK